jgi:hypothetical protein
MKTAKEGGKDRQNQTQTNTLETKTIRVKSWRDSLSLLTRTPAIVAIAAGFLMLFSLPSLAANMRSEKDDTASENLQPLLPAVIHEATAEEPTEAQNPVAEPKSYAQESQESSSASVRINMSVNSSSSGDDEGNNQSESTVTVNGEMVDLPTNGRINEVIEDENSRTRIRGRIEGNSSIRISTDSDLNLEGD